MDERGRLTIERLVPRFEPLALPRDPASRLGAKLILALVRCGYAGLAASFMEQATSAAKLERAGQAVAVSSQMCEACSIAAERYANECQAAIVDSAPLRGAQQLVI